MPELIVSDVNVDNNDGHHICTVRVSDNGNEKKKNHILYEKKCARMLNACFYHETASTHLNMHAMHVACGANSCSFFRFIYLSRMNKLVGFRVVHDFCPCRAAALLRRDRNETISIGWLRLLCDANNHRTLSNGSLHSE